MFQVLFFDWEITCSEAENWQGTLPSALALKTKYVYIISISDLFTELQVQLSNFKNFVSLPVHCHLKLSVADIELLFPFKKSLCSLCSLLPNFHTWHHCAFYKNQEISLTLLTLTPTSKWSNLVVLSPKSILNPSTFLHLHWDHPYPGNHQLRAPPPNRRLASTLALLPTVVRVNYKTWIMSCHSPA